MRTIGLALVLFAFWLALSAHFDPFLLVSGAVTAIVVAVLGQAFGYGDAEGFPAELAPRAVGYWAWLVKEIAASAWTVTRIVVDPRLRISPGLFALRAGQATPVGLATYANSITLTPGTITAAVDSHDRVLTVHALTEAAATDLQRGDMDRRVSSFAGRR